MLIIGCKDNNSREEYLVASSTLLQQQALRNYEIRLSILKHENPQKMEKWVNTYHSFKGSIDSISNHLSSSSQFSLIYENVLKRLRSKADISDRRFKELDEFKIIPADSLTTYFYLQEVKKVCAREMIYRTTYCGFNLIFPDTALVSHEQIGINKIYIEPLEEDLSRNTGFMIEYQEFKVNGQSNHANDTLIPLRLKLPVFTSVDSIHNYHLKGKVHWINIQDAEIIKSYPFKAKME
ncbi:MAG: hypothetical protein N4A46_11775 [Schleiferiaceae bacterium]|nr:hypothetical protein [Schleiferiaceae bacterium]